jgi:hypothetical protein
MDWEKFATKAMLQPTALLQEPFPGREPDWLIQENRGLDLQSSLPSENFSSLGLPPPASAWRIVLASALMLVPVSRSVL